MIVEIAIFEAQPGQADAMEAALRTARAVLTRAEGYLGSVFYRGIERPEQFVLHITWESVAHHLDGFRNGPLFPEWRGHFSRFLAGQPNVSHFTAITEA